MTRSLILPYLFVILAISYLGGAILARTLDENMIIKMLKLIDERLLLGQEVAFWVPLILPVVLMIVILLLNQWQNAKGFILIVAALKGVFFGIGSSFLLTKKLQLVAYTIWWFPFQLVLSLLFLIFAVKLAPPFFMKRTGKLDKNNRPLILILILILLLTIIESNIYPFMIK